MAGYTVNQLKIKYGEQWRWYAVLALTVASMATIFSATAINVALPDIMSEFSLGQGEVHWIVTGYLAAMTVSMLCTSWLLDRFGIRNCTLICALLFSMASIIGGISTNIYQLFIARVFLGAIAGLMQSMGMYLIFRIFPQEKRGSVLGIYSFGIILAPAFAPALGGYLVEYLNWRYVLFAPVPITIVAMLLAYFFLPTKTNSIEKYKFDLLGFIYLILLMVSFLDALNSMKSDEIITLRSYLSPMATLVFLYLFVRQQRVATHSLLNISLLVNRQFLYAGTGALALGFAMFGGTYLIPVYMQEALAFAPSEAGLVMLPAGVVLGVASLLTSRLTNVISSKYLLLFGGFLLITSSAMLALSTLQTTFIYIAIMAVVGRLGLSFMLPASTTAALNLLPTEELSQGSSIISFLRQFGGVLGINLTALMVDGIETSNALADSLPLGGYTAGWMFMTLFVLVLMLPMSRLKS